MSGAESPNLHWPPRCGYLEEEVVSGVTSVEPGRILWIDSVWKVEQRTNLNRGSVGRVNQSALNTPMTSGNHYPVDTKPSGPLDISVVVPIYNDSRGVQTLVPKLIDQSLSRDRFELLLVDNDSTDRTPEILYSYQEDFPSLITILREEKIQGSYAARNKGIEQAAGRIIAFTDSDCVPSESWLSQGLKRFEDERVDLVAGRIEYTFERDRPNTWEYLDAALHLDQASYADEGWAATANLFVRRSCFESEGLFEQTISSGGDAEFGRRLSNKGYSIKYAPDAIVRHPARRRMSDLLKKERRIALGYVECESFEHVPIPSLEFRQFLPAVWIPKLNDYSPTIGKKLSILLAVNLVRFVRAWTRLFGRLRSGS